MDADAVGFVISLNLHRRHLTESQRATVAAKLANMAQGERTDIEPSANLQKVSQADAAKLLNVSTRSVAAAAKVIHDGDEDLVHAVERGEVAVSAYTAQKPWSAGSPRKTRAMISVPRSLPC